MKLPEVDLTLPAARRQRDGLPETLADIASTSPAILDPDVHRVRTEERVQFAISHLPATYKRLFMQRAREEGLTHKALFIAMMRSYGIEVPDADQIDGRYRG